MHIQFLGANRQVTGSCSVLEVGSTRIMIDCGLFQERAHVSRNWDAPAVDPGSIDALVLTHAHLDHTGRVPRLVKAGYRKPIITTEPTVELAKLIMLDSGRIQEEDAKYKKRRHRKERRAGPHREVPLYRMKDARRAARLLKGVRFGQATPLAGDVRVTFHEAGHILGSAIVELSVGEGDRTRHIIFSGDIGQWNKPLIGDPTLLTRGDYVVMESTYGDRDHRHEGGIEPQLERAVNETVQRGGNIVIPTFAVERAQELVYHFGRLVREGRIPDIPIYLDSPMAVDVTDVFRRFRRYLDAETQQLLEAKEPPLRYHSLRLCRSTRQSKAINRKRGSKVIMSTSGMCTAGRIKHHLRQNISRPESTILFVGYQPHGTLGRVILDGADEVRIHGKQHPVRAAVGRINGMSAHGDRDDLLRWIGSFDGAPRRVFLNHGEEEVALALATAVRERCKVPVHVPEYGEVVELE